MKNKVLSIMGVGDNRQPYDFYPTPVYVTEALLKRETFEGDVWECASGSGKMSKVIEKYNECFSSDFRVDDVYGQGGWDFLTQLDKETDNIITNPPYKHATQFVLRAKQIANKKIAMILKLTFLESMGRYKKIFTDKEFPLKSVYVFSGRIQFSPDGAQAGSPTLSHAWYVWDKNYEGKPTLSWIDSVK